MTMQQLCCKVWNYARDQYWELPANILEGITLVLLVFVQDVALKESVVVCAALLFLSLGLHGLAYRAGQCKVWPKVIEMAAPVPFVAMIPAAYLATVPTQKTAFITINMWFTVVEIAFMLAGRNFMAEYLQDWNPREVWGTPLLKRCANMTAAVWIICQILMALAQALAYALNLSVDNPASNVGAAIFVCYIMQLLPLLFAIAFTFVYPAQLKKLWGYVKGVRATCYPPPRHDRSTSVREDDGAQRVIDVADRYVVASKLHSTGSSASQGSMASSSSSSSSGVSSDALVCMCPPSDGKKGTNKRSSSSSSGGSSRSGSSSDGRVDHQGDMQGSRHTAPTGGVPQQQQQQQVQA